MFRVLLVGAVLLVASGCERGVRSELAIYDWEAQRTTSQAHGAHGVHCELQACPDPAAKDVYVLDAPKLTSGDLDRKTARADSDPVTGQPIVFFQFTKQGQERFKALTRTLAQRGKARGTPQHLLLAIDDRVYASPYIDFKNYPAGLSGDTGVQLPASSRSEAERLADGLRG